MPEGPEGEALRRRLGYLTLARLAFALFLLASAAAVQLGWGESGSRALQPLYGFTAAVFVLSALYLALWRVAAARCLAYAQVLGDVALVSVLIHLTGGAESIFSFLYFPVIIAASSLLLRPGGLVAASASAILFGLLIDLHYYGLIHPLAATGAAPAAGLLYKAVTHTAAFFVVAHLSARLAGEAESSAAKLSVKQRELARLESFNHNVVQSMTSGLMTADGQRRLTSMNRAAEQILGLSQADCLGRAVEELLPEVVGQMGPAEGPGPEPDPEAAPRRHLVFRRPRGGEALYLGFSVSPLRDADGSSLGHVLIFRDLTRLRQMEDRVRQMDRLAAVGELAAGLAHEIRNPLASISGGVQMLSADPHTPPENQRLLAIIQREAGRLNGLVGDFLLFARPGTRPRQRLDLAHAVDEALEGAAAPEGVALEVEAPEGLWVTASPEEMRQVLANLVRNGLEAMPEGGTLRVGAGHEGEFVRLRVSDTGRGIDPEDLSRIFLPFFSRKERGTGLGLAIVHAIIERHGGRIEVESRPGGTCFTAWLPSLAKETDSPAATLPAPSQTERPSLAA